MTPKCPYCGIEIISKEVAEMHMKEKHKEEIEKAEKEKKEKKKDKKEEIKNRREWNGILIRNYSYELCHNKKCKVTLHNDQVLEGLVHAKDAFFILVDTEDGRRMAINKGYVVMIEPKE